MIKFLFKEELVKFSKEYKDYDQLSGDEKKSYEIETIKENTKNKRLLEIKNWKIEYMKIIYMMNFFIF